jgi:hypothetical protein
MIFTNNSDSAFAIVVQNSNFYMEIFRHYALYPFRRQLARISDKRVNSYIPTPNKGRADEAISL